MNLKQKAFKGIIWSAIESWGRQAISTIIFFVLARLLTPEAFGLIALSSVFIAFIQIFLDQGFSQAIVQREEVEPEHLDTAFWTNITISTLLTLTSIAFADQIALLFKEPALAPILRWLSLNFILISLSSVQEAVLARQFAFKALATRSLIAIVVGGSLGLGMAILGYGVWSLVAYQLVNASVRVLVLWWSSDWRPGFKVSLLHFKQLFSFGINIVGNNCLSFLDRRSDDFLIGFFLGSVALGYYSIAYKVLLTTTELLMGFVNKVAMPVFSRLQDNPERLRQAFYRSTQLTSLIAFPCFIGIALSAPEIVHILLGDKWIPSIPVMQILSLVGILQAISYFYGTAILAMGKSSWVLFFSSFNTIGNVIAFLIAVQWGILAVATAYVIRGALFTPLGFLQVKHLLKVKLPNYLQQLFVPFIAAGTMLAVGIPARVLFSQWLPPIALFTLLLVIGMAAYISVVIILDPTLLNGLLRVLRKEDLIKPKGNKC